MTKEERLKNVLEDPQRIEDQKRFIRSVDYKEMMKSIRRDLKIYLTKTYAKDLGVKIVSCRRYGSQIEIIVAHNDLYFTPLYLAKRNNEISIEEYFNRKHSWMDDYTKEGMIVLEDIKSVCDAYRYDNSDPMTDYFDFNYFTYVTIE